MTPDQVQLGELALIHNLPMQILPALKPGRLQSRYITLFQLLDKDLRATVEDMNYLEVEQVRKWIILFGQLSGWEGKPKHVATMISFCLEIIENSEFRFRPEVIKSLQDIYDYYDRVKDAHVNSVKAGIKAREAWHQSRESIELEQS